MTSEQVAAALDAIVKLQQAMQGFLQDALPVLQEASLIIASMQAQGRELPTAEERATLQSEGKAIDQAAQAAIDQAVP